MYQLGKLFKFTAKKNMPMYQNQDDDVLGRNMPSLQNICCVDGNKIQH